MYWLLEQGILSDFKRFCASNAGAQMAHNTVCASDKTILRKGGELVIPIKGILTKKPNILAAMFYGANTSYEQVAEILRGADMDDDVSKITLEIDSPGGEVDGVYMLYEQIRATQKPVIAYVDGTAASAAYGAAASCDAIYCSHLSNVVGSVGVVQSFYAGDDIVEITSTESPNKRPDLQSHEGKAEIRRHLDEMYEMFVDAIAKGRRTTRDEIVENYGKGSVFLAQNALQRSMIDGIIGAELSQNLTNGSKKEAKLMDKATLQAEHPALYAEIIAEGVEQERDRAGAHLVWGEKAGMLDRAAQAVRSGEKMTETLRAEYESAAATKAAMGARADDNPDIHENTSEARGNAAAQVDEEALQILKQRMGL